MLDIITQVFHKIWHLKTSLKNLKPTPLPSLQIKIYNFGMTTQNASNERLFPTDYQTESSSTNSSPNFVISLFVRFKQTIWLPETLKKNSLHFLPFLLHFTNPSLYHKISSSLFKIQTDETSFLRSKTGRYF